MAERREAIRYLVLLVHLQMEYADMQICKKKSLEEDEGMNVLYKQLCMMHVCFVESTTVVSFSEMFTAI